MGRAAATTVSILVMILAACTGISVSSAAFPPENDSRKFFFPTDPHVTECWNTFSLVPGCVEEIFRSFATGTIGIGPACCKVITQVADKCLPKFAGFYPFNPLLSPLIKAHCQNPSAPAPHTSLV
ncbi:hypothetical protein H6P81_019462 [Aristolochia fimbriata]|uniref:Prolamin-like domain-containing protein n=1 Tax=Aristolochia fimbriata TaxID=158543 RepID=A0AAV7DRV1_ARIFI|nr:hypothetical protein H6P81_019462 [Aristolochia fimbriata]